MKRIFKAYRKLKKAERNGRYVSAMNPLLALRPLRDHSDHCVLPFLEGAVWNNPEDDIYDAL